MIKRNRFQQNPRFHYRINERISAPELRVLDRSGKQIGIFSRSEALRLARDEGLDLVEIAAQAQPPVVKIIDFNKFLYQQAKKKQEEKRKTKISETKEIRLGPFMSENDLNVMVRRGREFLDDGNKIRLVVKFKGREIIHPEFGHEIIRKIISALSDISKIEREAHMEGKQLVALISPERKKTHSNDQQSLREMKHYAEEKNKRLSSETL